MVVSQMSVPSPEGDHGELLSDRAYRDLRERLVTLQIRPGAPLNEDALMRVLMVGRTPVRNAVRRLALEDLVRVYPRRGTFAAEVRLSDLDYLVDMRLALEPHATARACERAGNADLAALQQIREAMTTPDQGWRVSMDTHNQLHRALFRAADNPPMEDVLLRQMNLSMRIWHLVHERGDRDPHLHDHLPLLDAVLRRDAEQARVLAVEHVRDFEREVRQLQP